MARFILHVGILLAVIFFAVDSNAQSPLVKFQVFTDKQYEFYLPSDRDASHVLQTTDGIACITGIKHKEFVRMRCDKGLRNLIFFEERSPELKTIIMTSEILIQINGLKENK